MRDNPNRKIEPLYPDVLGAITDGVRISMDKLQTALGIFPRRTFVNQPVEVILIVQNMVDQNMQLKVGVQLPTTDKKGNPVVIDTPKKLIAIGMRPGEVGVLRIPIIPLPPTQSGVQFPVRIAIRYRTAEEGHAVRPPAGGAPPSVLTISPVKLQVLRDVEYAAQTWNQSAEIITTYFDVAAKRIEPLNQDLQTRYESLWTMEEMAEETHLIQARVQDAVRVASGLTRSTLLRPIVRAVEERFAARGMPLHPGESKAIAKMITYTLDEGLDLEPGFSTESSRWFQVLCQVLAHDESVEDLDRPELATRYLFDSAIYDAVLLGFALIDPKIKEDLGDSGERLNFANRILLWLAGQVEPDLTFIYLPLVMGGLVVNLFVNPRDDNPWLMVDQLREASRGRARLVSGDALAIFHMMDELLDDAEDQLRRARIPRS